MANKKIQMQDSKGNIIYPATVSELVTYGSGNVNDTLIDLESRDELFISDTAPDNDGLWVDTSDQTVRPNEENPVITQVKKHINDKLEDVNAQLNAKVYYFDTVSDLINSNLAFGDFAITKGYYSIDDGGGTEYYINNSINEDTDFYECLDNGEYAIQIIKDKVNVKTLGVRGNKSDETTLLQGIIDKMFNRLYQLKIRNILYFPNGDYGITNQLIFNVGEGLYDIYAQPFTKILMIDENFTDSMILFNATMRGATGRNNIDNIELIGNNKCCGIEDKGVCNIIFNKINFSNLADSAILHNTSLNGNGLYTECVLFNNCNFNSTCTNALHYKFTDGGENSFHASGLEKCNINVVGRAILIDKFSLPYNAPLNFNCWKTNNDTPIIQNNSSYNVNFYGNICIERPALDNRINIKLVDGFHVYFSGGINSFYPVEYSKLVLCDRINWRSISYDGAITVQAKPYKIKDEFSNKNTGTTSIIPNLSEIGYCYVYIKVTSDNYRRDFLYDCFVSGANVSFNLIKVIFAYGNISSTNPTFSAKATDITWNCDLYNDKNIKIEYSIIPMYVPTYDI